MNRRKFINTLAWAAGYPALGGVSGSLLAQSAYSGKFLMTLQLDGGLDVTSFCDPKINVSGEREINRWARTQGIQQAGNLSYAPFATNTAFFQKYYRDILIVNGVDAQTNSHTVGVVNNWSGRNAEGFPSITALMAAQKAPELPLAYLNFGGFGDTANVVRSTVIDEVSQLRDIIYPNQANDGGSGRYRNDSDWQRIRALQSQNLQALAARPDLLAGDRLNRTAYMEAFSNTDGIKQFGDKLPTLATVEPVAETEAEESQLQSQIQTALLAFSSGVSVAADVVTEGFDTHENHDALHAPLLSATTAAIDYLWTYAGSLGIADRLVLVVGSDFGRTPHYNSAQGKDHWPIGSYMVMEKNASFTNRVVGQTDEGHNAIKLNVSSLKASSSEGVILKPSHFHKALRAYLGIQSSAFSLAGVEDISFFA